MRQRTDNGGGAPWPPRTTPSYGAAAVGMIPFLHRGADTTLPELERLLGLGLR